MSEDSLSQIEQTDFEKDYEDSVFHGKRVLVRSDWIFKGKIDFFLRAGVIHEPPSDELGYGPFSGCCSLLQAPLGVSANPE